MRGHRSRLAGQSRHHSRAAAAGAGVAALVVPLAVLAPHASAATTTVTLGPTSTAAATASQAGPGYRFGSISTPAQSGLLTRFATYVSGGTSAQTLTPVIYTITSGQPSALLAVGNSFTVAANQSAGWVTRDISASVVAGRPILLGLWSRGPTGGAFEYSQSVAGGGVWASNAGGTTTPDPSFGTANAEGDNWLFDVTETVGTITTPTTSPATPPTTPPTIPSVVGLAKAAVWQTDDISASNGGFDTGNANVIAAITKDATDMQAAGVKWARWWVGPGDSVAQNQTVATIYRDHDVSLELDVNAGSNSDAANELAIESWLSTMVPAMSAVGDHFWEIGNEPNIDAQAGGYWDDCQPGVTPSGASGQGDPSAAVASYVLRLKDAYTTIRHYDSSAFVSSAGLSYDSGYSAYCEIPSDQWIAALVQTDAYQYMSCFGIHPYSSSPAGVVSALADTRNALDVSANYASIPFCVTEVGFWANGYTPGSQNGFIGTNDENVRAVDYVTLMKDLKSYGISTPVFWYTWYDYDQPEGYGIVHYSGFTSRTYLPIYTAMQDYTP